MPESEPIKNDPFIRLSDAQAIAVMLIASALEVWQFLKARPDLIDDIVKSIRQQKP